MKHPKLTWTGIILGGLLAATAIIWLALNFETSRRLRRELQAIRDRGEPLYLCDLAREPIPDEQNAVTYYRRAAKHPLLSGTYDDQFAKLRDAMWYCEHRSFRQEHRVEFEQMCSIAEAEIIPIVAQARGLGKYDWGIDYGASPVFVVLENMDIYDALKVHWVLASVAFESAERGDTEAACRYLMDLRDLAHSLYHEPLLICCLVAVADDGLMSSVVEQIAPRLDAQGPGERKSVEELIGLLLDDSMKREGLRSALMGERAFEISALEDVKAGRLRDASGSGREGFMPDFYVTYNEIALLRHMARYLDASEAQTWPEAKRRMPDEMTAQRRGVIGRIMNMLADMEISSVNAVFEIHYRNLGRQRMAATALAIRLYELDHGRRPETLNQLVSQYVPAVPNDPFSASPSPIGYAPGADPPVLYCVGLDGQDNGGAFVVDNRGDLDWRESPDQVFFLNGDRPYAPIGLHEDTLAGTQPSQPGEAVPCATTATVPAATAPSGSTP